MKIETINQKYFDLTKRELEMETSKKKPVLAVRAGLLTIKLK